MYETLTDTWSAKLDRAKVTALVGPDRAKELYSQESPLDHFVVGDPAQEDDAKHSKPKDDEGGDDDEIQPEKVLKAGVTGSEPQPATFPDVTSALWPLVAGQIAGTQREIR